jgi:hypothetical protein
MCGSATLAMEVSSTSMKAASATVAAMIHGLTLGFQFWSADAVGILSSEFGSENFESGSIGRGQNANCAIGNKSELRL